MLHSYLTVAIRNLLRHPGYALINVVGLAIGMTCALLITAYIRYEFSFDTHHKKLDRIYRVLSRNEDEGGDPKYHGGAPGGMVSEIVASFPGVEAATRLFGRGTWVRHENRAFDRQIGVIDPAFFDVFTVPLVEGDPASLETPNTVFLSTETADLLFGNTDPMGKIIEVDHRYFRGDYLVTGLYVAPPATSTVRFDLLTTTTPVIHFGWWDRWRNYEGHVEAWVLLKPGQDAATVEAGFPDVVRKNHAPTYAGTVSYSLQPLRETHLYARRDYGAISEAASTTATTHGTGRGDIRHIYTLGAIGLFVVVIACVNFTNLSTALASGRAREIGMRKTSGARRSQLFGQFIVESLCLAFVALLLTLVLTQLAIPKFNQLIQREISLVLVSPEQIAVLIAIFAAVGLAAGWYPALHLSSFRPTEVLKGGTVHGGGRWIRETLVVVQFTLSIGLVAATLTVHRQQAFAGAKDLGFKRDEIVVIPIFSADRMLNRDYESVKSAFLRHPTVQKATASQVLMGGMSGDIRVVVEPEGKHGEEWKMFHLAVDEDFADTYDLEIVAGRFLSRDFPSDATSAWVLNETAVLELGWADPQTGSMTGALGRQMKWFGREGTVVGVVKDFHYKSLHEPITPLFLLKWWPKQDLLSLRISMTDFETTRAHLQKTWDVYIPGQPFQFYFLDEDIDQLYADEQRVGQTFGVVAALAIFVACLGLLGLTSYTVRQRTKEIGVRKVMGASVVNVVFLISKEFVVLVAVASTIAAPIAYFTMERWLDRFHYRIDVGIDLLALSGTLALVVALVTVSYHAFRASSTDPVEALRHE